MPVTKHKYYLIFDQKFYQAHYIELDRIVNEPYFNKDGQKYYFLSQHQNIATVLDQIFETIPINNPEDILRDGFSIEITDYYHARNRYNNDIHTKLQGTWIMNLYKILTRINPKINTHVLTVYNTDNKVLYQLKHISPEDISYIHQAASTQLFNTWEEAIQHKNTRLDHTLFAILRTHQLNQMIKHCAKPEEIIDFAQNKLGIVTSMINDQEGHQQYTVSIMLQHKSNQKLLQKTIDNYNQWINQQNIKANPFKLKLDIKRYIDRFQYNLKDSKEDLIVSPILTKTV